MSSGSRTAFLPTLYGAPRTMHSARGRLRSVLSRRRRHEHSVLIQLHAGRVLQIRRVRTRPSATADPTQQRPVGNPQGADGAEYGDSTLSVPVTTKPWRRRKRRAFTARARPGRGGHRWRCRVAAHAAPTSWGRQIPPDTFELRCGTAPAILDDTASHGCERSR